MPPVCRDGEQAGVELAGRVTFQSQLCMHVRGMVSRQGTRLSSHSCACTCYDKQAGRVTFQSQLCMHVLGMVSRQGTRLSSHNCACTCSAFQNWRDGTEVVDFQTLFGGTFFGSVFSGAA